MWFLLLLLHIVHTELVISQAVNRVILRTGNDNPCEGHVEVYHDNKMGYVGDKHWSNKTEKVVCSSTHCGEPVESSDWDLPDNRTIWLNELKCEGNEKHLWDCPNFPGWNFSYYPMLTVKKVKCSSNITISLDETKCSGAVQYSTGDETGYFCADNWKNENKAAKLLCERLDCGKVKAIPEPKWTHKKSENKPRMKLSCTGIEQMNHLWQCITSKVESKQCKPAFLTCEGHRRLQFEGTSSNACSGQLQKEEKGRWKNVSETMSWLETDVCQHMHCGTSASGNPTEVNNFSINCTDTVEVVLGESRTRQCYGTVNIRVNNSQIHPVCNDDWTLKNSELVCKTLGCKDVVYHKQGAKATTGIMDHVQCTGTESSLWHCPAHHAKNIQCSRANIICSGSLDVRLVDGPGKCAGRLEIKHEGKWKRVDKEKWTKDLSNSACSKVKCGKTGETEKFSQGSGDFLSMECSDGKKDIYECLTESSEKPKGGDREAVGIICEAHRVVFLSGICEGEVKIKDSKGIHWLSGSNKTWNRESANAVCQQMHCGNATNFSSTPESSSNKIWGKSLSCSSSSMSLFDCGDKKSKPEDHNSSTARVICSGKIEMNLTNGCWGTVTFKVGNVSGEMSADTWTEEKSNELCKNLNCGTAIKAYNNPQDGNIAFKSLHTAGKMTDLRQCNFVIKKPNDPMDNNKPAYVVCSGSVKPKFKTSRDRCSGNIELEYEGKWLPVCKTALEGDGVGKTICGDLGCGNSSEPSLLSYFGPTPETRPFISGIQCNAGPLSKCNFTAAQSCTEFKGLKCQDSRMIALSSRKACSGKVIVQQGSNKYYVSGEGWNNTEGKSLCKDLNCSGYEKHKKGSLTTNGNFWPKSFSCKGPEPQSIWECENKIAPRQNMALDIECGGEPSITLSNNCHGKLKINDIPVCGSDWKLEYAHRVCQQKDCGNALYSDLLDVEKKDSTEGYHISCDDKHHSLLGQCRRIKGHCNKRWVSISCSESVRFGTTGKRGGKLLVNYRNTWEAVCYEADLITGPLMEKLCAMKLEENINLLTSSTLETKLTWTLEHNDVKRSIEKTSCAPKTDGVNIYCSDYIPPTTPPKPTIPPSTPTPIIVGVGFLLVIVILIFVFVRFCIVKRARKANVLSSMFPDKEIEFESGEYEDVTNQADEMDDFSRGRFRSEAEFISENDAHSHASLAYDDIDEADENQPLTTPGSPAPAAQEDDMHKDGVSYEVEDPQESYDDIDASSEVMETKAEVHGSPQTPRDATEPPALVRSDEDYLEPDEEG